MSDFSDYIRYRLDFADGIPAVEDESFPVLDDDFLEVEPEATAQRSSWGNFRLVGNGVKTNEFCGRFMRFKGCPRVELHNKVTLDGQDCTGKVPFRPVLHFCDKPDCPVCFKHGWVFREANNIKVRLAEASKRFGAVEHVVCSVPVKDYDLNFDILRLKAEKLLVARGVVGGAMVFHAGRFTRRRGWYWSPHFHVLGFILGGYSRCRYCKHKNRCVKGCGGFDDRSWQHFLKDGWYVKVASSTQERKSVFHTAKYELGHATIDVSKVRFHVVTWFGVVSYRKLKVTVEKRKEVCPICQEDYVDLVYSGSKRFVTDVNSPDFKRELLEDYLEDGVPAFTEIVRSSRCGSGSYEE